MDYDTAVEVLTNIGDNFSINEVDYVIGDYSDKDLWVVTFSRGRNAVFKTSLTNIFEAILSRKYFYRDPAFNEAVYSLERIERAVLKEKMPHLNCFLNLLYFNRFREEAPQIEKKNYDKFCFIDPIKTSDRWTRITYSA